ncbi:hypothetical protein Tco_0793049 [Tanacetum coccineum]
MIGSTNDRVSLPVSCLSAMEDDVDISALTMEQYIALILDDIKLGIVNPKIGTDDEDAYEHVRTVLEIVDLFHFPNVTHDAIMLRQEGRAMCNHAWERYNDLLYQCPLHDMNCQQKVHIFYTGLDISTRKILYSNGFIPLMTPTQALESIQVMADHSHDCGRKTYAPNGLHVTPVSMNVVEETTLGDKELAEDGDNLINFRPISNSEAMLREFLVLILLFSYYFHFLKFSGEMQESDKKQGKKDLKCSISINRGLIQAIPTSLPPQPIGEATKAFNLRRISPRVQGRSHFTYFLYLIVQITSPIFLDYRVTLGFGSTGGLDLACPINRLPCHDRIQWVLGRIINSLPGVGTDWSPHLSLDT